MKEKFDAFIRQARTGIADAIRTTRATLSAASERVRGLLPDEDGVDDSQRSDRPADTDRTADDTTRSADAGSDSSLSTPDPDGPDGRPNPIRWLVGTVVPDVIRRNFLAKVLVGLFGIVILSAAIGGYSYLGISEDLDSQVDRQVRATTTLHENAYSSWFQNRQDELDSVVSSEDLVSGSPDDISRDLDIARSESEAIQHYHYVNTETGEVVASSNDEAIGENMFEAAFNQTTAQQQSFIYDQQYTSFSGSPAIALGKNVPYVDRVLVAVINPENSGPELEQTVRGANTTVVNTNGELVIGSGSISEIPENVTENTTVTQSSTEILAYQTVGTTDGLVLVTETPTSEAFSVKEAVLQSFGLTMLLTFVILIGVTLVGGRSVIRDLNGLVQRAKAMGQGDLEVDLETTRRDEIGVLYDEFDVMRGQLKERIQEARNALDEAEDAREEAESARIEAQDAREEAERMNEHLEQKADEYSSVMRACANGDFTQRMDFDTESEAMAEIADEFNAMIAQIEETISQVKTFADEVSTASREVANGAEDVRSASEKVSKRTQEISDGASEQNHNLESVSAEMSNLSASIQQAASSSSQVAETAERAVDRGEDGRIAAETAIDEMDHVESQTDKTVEQIEILEEKMTEIGEIVDFITDIAEQTNILALNANIEAARAGEAGSGFAVVANEVKDLAEETQSAAGEIEEVITEVQDHTRSTATEMQDTSDAVSRGVDTVEEALDALEEIVAQIEDTNRGIQEISEATEDQANSTQRVVSQVDEVAEISKEVTGQTEDVAAASEEQTASITEIADNADYLRERAGTLAESLGSFEVTDGEGGESMAITDTDDADTASSEATDITPTEPDEE